MVINHGGGALGQEHAADGDLEHGRVAAKGAVLLFAAQFTLTVSGYVVALALARALGPELYGAYGIVYSVLLSIELIGRLGLPQAVSKLVAETRTDASSLEATGITIAIIVFATIFAGFWLAAPVLGALFHVADGARLFRIAAIDIPFYGVYFMIMHILGGRRRFHVVSRATIVYGVSKAAGILILVQIGPSIAGALLVNAAGSIIALAVAAAHLGRAPFRLTLAQRAPIIRLAVPVAVISLGTQILANVDLWVLNAVGAGLDDALKGFYVAAVNVARMPNLVAFVMAGVLVPSIAAAFAADDLALARSLLAGAVRFMAIVLVPACALVALNASEVLVLLFSSDYAGGGNLLAILVFAHGMLQTLFMTFANVLIATGSAAASARLALAALAFATAISTGFVLWFGALGAALGALIANAAAVGGAGVLLGRVIGVPVDLSVCARVILLTVLVAVPSWWLEARGMMLVVEFALLGMVYLALLPLAGLVGRADLDPFLPKWSKRTG